MRQATNALLAAPVALAARFGALLRRSTLTRAGLALGLAFVLGVGVLGTGQPQTTVATRTTPILPLAQTAFTTTFSTDRGLSEPVTIAFTTPMDAASVAGAHQGGTGEARRPVVGRDREDPDGHSARSLVARHVHHGDGPGGHSRRVRSAACPAGALGLPDPRRDDRLDHPDRAFRDAGRHWIRSSSCRSASPSTPRRSGTRSGSTHRPPAPSVRCSGARVRHASNSRRPPHCAQASATSSSSRAPTTPTASRSRTSLSPSGPSRPRPSCASARSPRARTWPATPRSRFASPRRWIGAAPPARSRSRSAARRSPDPVRWAEKDTVLVFTPKSALPYSSKVSMKVAASATNTSGVPLAAAADRKLPNRQQGRTGE